MRRHGVPFEDIPDWACDSDVPHGSHLWSDGKLGMECPGFSTSARIDAPKQVAVRPKVDCVRYQAQQAQIDMGLEPFPYIGECRATCCKPWEPEKRDRRMYRAEAWIGGVVAVVLAFVLAPYADDAAAGLFGGVASATSQILDSFQSGVEDGRRPPPMEVNP